MKYINPIDLQISRESFISEYFEKEIFYAPQALAKATFTWDDFSRDFYALEPGMGQVRLYRDGPVERSEFLQGSQRDGSVAYDFKPDALRDLLTAGGSLVVNRFDKTSAFVADLCQQLAQLTGNSAVGNAYATQGGTGTFGKHWDTHCVFVIQLIGSKRWKVYRPTFELPLEFQTSRYEKATFDGELVFEKDLHAGDILYLPRGWWHQVTPIPGVPSLHISTGIYTVKVHDYVRWILGSKMPGQSIFRQSMNSLSENKTLESALRALSDACCDQDSFHEFVNQQHGAANVKQAVNFGEIFHNSASLRQAEPST